MVRHLPAASARRYSARLAERLGADFELSRVTLGLTVEDVAHRASLASSTVARVLHGDGGAHLDTICAVGEAVGMKVGAKAYPSVQPGLRDSGQLRMAEHLIGCAHASFRAAMELPVGDTFGRAADLVFFGTDEILHFELERRLVDLQAQSRAAMLKRDALQARHQRPVRLVLAIEDTRRNRGLVAAHRAVMHTALAKTSRHVMHALRAGTPLGGDGLVWVRPWESASAGARREAPDWKPASALQPRAHR